MRDIFWASVRNLLWSCNNLKWLVPFIFPFLNSKPDHCCCWQAILILKFWNFCSRTRNHRGMEELLCPDSHAPKPAKVLRIPRYAKILLSVSHLHSHSSWNTDCVCSAGIPVVSKLLCHSKSSRSAQLICVDSCRLRAQLQEGRPCIHVKAEDYPAKPLFISLAKMRMLTLHRLRWECVGRRGRAGPRRGGS